MLCDYMLVTGTVRRMHSSDYMLVTGTVRRMHSSVV